MIACPGVAVLVAVSDAGICGVFKLENCEIFMKT